MSNFGKIKNIWNLDVVSREEMKTILQEWDDALTSLQTEVNEVKRLTTLITIKPTNTIPGNGNLQIPLNPRIDDTRPIYIGFEKWDKTNTANVADAKYSIISFNADTSCTYNNINDIKFWIQNSKLYISGFNFNSNIVFKNFVIQYTPKTLTTTLETQEEGEAWEISK